MRCPCCGADLSLIPKPQFVPVQVFDEIEQKVVSDIIEYHERWEVRAAVAAIKKSKCPLFYRGVSISWARTVTGRLFVQAGSMFVWVKTWSDVVDHGGHPVLLRLES